MINVLTIQVTTPVNKERKNKVINDPQITPTNENRNCKNVFMISPCCLIKIHTTL